MRIVFFSSALVLTSLTVSCASTQTEHVKQDAAQRRVVRNNKAQPEWATDFYKKNENGRVFVVKLVENVFRLDVGIEQAKTQAMGEASQLIGAKIAKIATAAMTGDNTTPDGVAQSIDSAVTAVSALRMTGIEQSDLYWEQIKGEEGKKDHFNIYILLSMPVGEVERAKNLFLSTLGDNPKLQNLKDKVTEAVNSIN
ncbi:MAG: hypothetical protein RIR26_1406 [Pseudomonadota bacterium]|jgi:hypothetical protein